jgi:hypothetical protein
MAEQSTESAPLDLAKFIPQEHLPYVTSRLHKHSNREWTALWMHHPMRVQEYLRHCQMTTDNLERVVEAYRAHMSYPPPLNTTALEGHMVTGRWLIAAGVALVLLGIWLWMPLVFLGSFPFWIGVLIILVLRKGIKRRKRAHLLCQCTAVSSQISYISADTVIFERRFPDQAEWPELYRSLLNLDIDPRSFESYPTLGGMEAQEVLLLADALLEAGVSMEEADSFRPQSAK